MNAENNDPNRLAPPQSSCSALLEVPGLTYHEIHHVDATPDDEYPIRILEAYRQECDCHYEANPPSQLWEMMNEHNKQRIAILDKAIAKLRHF